MGYRSLQQCVQDLERHGHLVRIKAEMDPYLEIAEVQRRIYEAKGPALLFENVKGSPFPAVANLFGTIERSHFMFRDTLARMQKVMELKANPPAFLKNPFKYWDLPMAGIHALPRKKWFSAPVMYGETTLDKLPQIQSWPMDGGAFITLPQVYSEDPEKPGRMKSNLGMYRVQISGNDYVPNQELGLHYQIHRGIGVHHSKALAAGKPLKVSIFVGGPPSHTFAAVMPLPEGLAEVMFAGMLGGRSWKYKKADGHTISALADFCITGTITEFTKPEGPFGDHLGYYSLQHQFPVMKVEKVYHRKDAIWPFTVVGRPPQEDTSFGHLIHEITEPVVPTEIAGLRAMHAVDAAGVHPLLLAVGSERYVPYSKRKPQEILTIANAILGFNQASLAKYLMIVAGEDSPAPDIHDIPAFIQHLLQRIDWTRDLHFQTRTTIDTLDYSGSGFNEGSKVVMAAAGEPIRSLAKELPESMATLPKGFSRPKIALPGIVVVNSPAFKDVSTAQADAERLCRYLENANWPDALPMVVMVDDAEFAAAKINNFLWVTFTRSNPSHDIYGAHSSTVFKHWGCKGPLVIDARIKPHHAPPLVEDPKVTKRVDALFASGGILSKWG
ncbi:MAG: UbiD family decarboxylase [Bacteroidetes bacterium]|nr:UbiD family decarboxylase [Bacteroidota bacterium]